MSPEAKPGPNLAHMVQVAPLVVSVPNATGNLFIDGRLQKLMEAWLHLFRRKKQARTISIVQHEVNCCNR
jgi:hypothetical protein